MSPDQRTESAPDDADELIAMGVSMQAAGIGYGVHGLEGGIDLVALGISMQAAGQAFAEAGRRGVQIDARADARIQIGPLDV